MIVETKNASLDTMSVTIQALHVNGKQMTLAVFRQLPIASAFASDGSPSDLKHWGIVRYEIKDQGDIWLVASDNGALFRCSIHHYFGQTEKRESELEFAEECLRDYQEWESEEMVYRKRLSAQGALKMKLESECPMRDDGYGPNSRYTWVNKRLYETIGDIPVPKYRRSISSSQLKIGQVEDYKRNVDRARRFLEYSRRAADAVNLILLLPQLFIAV